MKLRLTKKGVIENLANLVVALGYIVVLIAVIFIIIAGTKTSLLNSSGKNLTSILTDSNYNTSWVAINGTQASMQTVPDWLPIVVITVIGGILLFLVRTFKSGN